jgi:hypothetical protein
MACWYRWFPGGRHACRAIITSNQGTLPRAISMTKGLPIDETMNMAGYIYPMALSDRADPRVAN